MSVPRLRTILLFALVVAAAVNVHGLVLNLRAHARLRDSAFATVRARVTGIRSAVGQRVALGGAYDRDSALRQALAEGPWESAEAFTTDGRRLGALPGPAGVDHWVSAAEMEALRGGAVLVGADPARRGERVLAYALFASADEQAVVRLAAASPELAADRAERELVFLGHLATLVVLLFAAGVLMKPPAASAEPAPPRALVAYEEAMERLRDRGEEQTQRHAAERRQMEDVLRDKEALARAGELTAGIVHEVRNGLGTIVGYARLVENAPAEAAENAARIRDECEALERVIRRFVDFVKRETLVLAPVDVATMLRRVAARESRRPGAAVEVAGAPGPLTADEGLLDTAIENLVRNAREAAGASGHVWVAAGREGGMVTITVSDDGPGFAPAVRQSLRPFFTTKAGGLGLGLAIALKIARLHGGDLVFGDRVPRGASVSIRLPGGDAPDATEGSAGVTEGGRAATGRSA